MAGEAMIGTLIAATVVGQQTLKPLDFDQVAVQPAVGEEVAVLKTTKGEITVMFFPSVAPKHVENFKSLVSSGFYNGVRFHRCIPGFMIQGGDPLTKSLGQVENWGTGGHEDDKSNRLTVPAEFSAVKHLRGVLSMARSSDPNSASSQFFVMHADYSSLDGKYSAFGKVVKGIEVVDEIVQTGQKERNGKVDTEKTAMILTANLYKWGGS